MKDWQLRLERLVNASDEERARIIAGMTPEALLRFDWLFELWAHRGQLPPPGDGWRTWLMMAGRGYGKTRAGAEWVHGLAKSRPGVRVALVGASIADARAIMVEGVSGLLNVAQKRDRRRRIGWEPSVGRLIWPNGSQAQLFSGDHGDGLRGPEFDFAWFLTFEIVGDEEAVVLGAILTDASDGDISSDAQHALIGYAAYGSSIAAAVAPLVSAYSVDLFDDGTRVRPPSDGDAIVISENMLGSSAEQQHVSRIYREQTPVTSVPSVLRLSYYDAARDFQSGEARALASDHSGREEQVELPAVLDAGDAKSLVHQMLASRWARRDKLTLRLPPAFVDLEPGDEIELPVGPAGWKVETCTLDAFVVIAELRPV